MSRVLAVARKTLREFTRNRRNLFLTLGLPVGVVLLFGFAFGAGSATDAYRIAVLDLDEGASWDAYSLGARGPNGSADVDPEATAALRAAGAQALGGNATFGRGFTQTLAAIRARDDARLLDVVRVASEAEGRELVRTRDVAALVVIPGNFSASLAAAFLEARGAEAGLVLLAPPDPPDAEVRIVGDPSHASFNVVHGVARGALSGYVEGVAPPSGVQVRPATESVLSSRLEPFDFIAPGLMVYAVLNIAPQCAAILTKEQEERTLDRLRITRVRPAELLGGVVLAQLVVATAEVLLMLGAAKLMGFHHVGSLADGFVVVILTALSVVGVGLVIAAFAGRTQEAANYGILFAVPASFLSGAFFPVPQVRLFEVAGRVVQPYDALPSAHATRALRDVLTYGRGLDDVLLPLAALVVLSALYFALGVWLYARRRLRVAR